MINIRPSDIYTVTHRLIVISPCLQKTNQLIHNRIYDSFVRRGIGTRYEIFQEDIVRFWHPQLRRCD